MVSKAFQDSFLSLVRLGIGKSSSDIPIDIDWNAVASLARKQGLLAVLVDAVNQAEKVETLPFTMKLAWIGEVAQGYEQMYSFYRKAVANLAAFYNTHGFKMMVLKGYGCSLNWPKPEHRPCGDIDIYLFGKYKEADETLTRELGIKIDHSHQHHTVFEWQGFTVENHYDFINIQANMSSRKLEKVLKRLAEGADDAEMIFPPANLHALFLIRHMVLHFAAISITLRQVLDWAFFVEKHGNEVDWGWLLPLLEQYHMKEFFDSINAICTDNLGFNWLSTYGLSVNEEGLQWKERILQDILEPEFDDEEPPGLLRRVHFKYRRWKANAWKRELCYEESDWNSFWNGVWNHLLKPASI